MGARSGSDVSGTTSAVASSPENSAHRGARGNGEHDDPRYEDDRRQTERQCGGDNEPMGVDDISDVRHIRLKGSADVATPTARAEGEFSGGWTVVDADQAGATRRTSMIAIAMP